MKKMGGKVMEKKMKKYLKLKGVIESDDGGKTWFISRIDYLSGSNDAYGPKNFIEVPEEWMPCKLVLERNEEKKE